jgi:hypothetical protein
MVLGPLHHNTSNAPITTILNPKSVRQPPHTVLSFRVQLDNQQIKMSDLLKISSDIHFEILVCIVIGRFEEIIDDLLPLPLSYCPNLWDRFNRLKDGDEGKKCSVIADLALVSVANAELALKEYLAVCIPAHRCWRSRRRAILRRAATECLATLEPRVKASRRKMMRAWFRSAVWGVVNEDYHQWYIKDNVRAEDAWMEFFECAQKFWMLDYKAASLREILSDEEDALDRLLELSDQVIRRVDQRRPETDKIPPEHKVCSSTKAHLSSANCL